MKYIIHNTCKTHTHKMLAKCEGLKKKQRSLFFFGYPLTLPLLAHNRPKHLSTRSSVNRISLCLVRDKSYKSSRLGMQYITINYVNEVLKGRFR